EIRGIAAVADANRPEIAVHGRTAGFLCLILAAEEHRLVRFAVLPVTQCNRRHTQAGRSQPRDTLAHRTPSEVGDATGRTLRREADDTRLRDTGGVAWIRRKDVRDTRR